MNLFRSVLFSLGVLLLANGLAQDVDSLRALWSDESKVTAERLDAAKAFYEAFVANRPKEVLESSLVHFELARRQEDVHEMIAARHSRGHAFFFLGNHDSLLVELDYCKELAVQSNDTTWLSKILPRYGIIHHSAGDYKAAMEAYRGGLSLAQQQGDYQLQGAHLCNIGLIYFDISANDLAYQYFDSALWAYDKAGVVGLTSSLAINLALLENRKENGRRALELGKEAERIARETDNRLNLAHSYMVMAEAHDTQGRKDSAEYEMRRGLVLAKELGNIDFEVMSSVFVAELIMDQRAQEAFALADRVESLLPRIDNYTILSSAYDLLYQRYRVVGELDRALAFKEMHQAYLDSLNREEESFQLIRQALDERYAVELSKKEQESLVNQKELKANQRMQVAGLLLFSLSAITVLLWFMRRRSLQQNREKDALLEELEKYRIAAESSPEEVESAHAPLDTFHLDRAKIEERIGRKLNETDWSVLTLLAEDPVLANKEIAERAFISVDGLGSALRRMYVYFEVKESKYKKISLLLEAVKLSKA